MRLRGLSLALAVSSLFAAPVLAAPAASRLSVASAPRAGASVTKTNTMVGGASTIALAGFLAFVAAVIVVHEVADDPDSP